MDAMLKACKSVEMDGLVWGANKLVPVGYGINKLQLMCVVEDEKVSFDTPLCYDYFERKAYCFHQCCGAGAAIFCRSWSRNFR